jgi:hypothetical protein
VGKNSGAKTTHQIQQWNKKVFVKRKSAELVRPWVMMFDFFILALFKN